MERADYLVALCANRLGKWQQAHKAASRGLAIIAANGEEDIDRAFLLLALARSCQGLGKTAEAEQARSEARSLAQNFDKEIRAWFDSTAGS